MIYKLVVPGPIEDVDEVRVLEWHGAEGRAVAPGDLIVELETHKALIEVRAAQAGILRKIACAPGAWRAPGQLLAVLSEGPEDELPSSPEALECLSVEFYIT